MRGRAGGGTGAGAGRGGARGGATGGRGSFHHHQHHAEELGIMTHNRERFGRSDSATTKGGMGASFTPHTSFLFCA